MVIEANVQLVRVTVLVRPVRLIAPTFTLVAFTVRPLVSLAP